MAQYTVGSGKAYATISAAYAATPTGTYTEEHEIIVYDGTYTETVTINRGVPTADYRLLIHAADGNSPVVSGGSSLTRCFRVYEPYVTISGFEITATVGQAIETSAAVDYLVISNNTIHGCGNYGIYFVAGADLTEIYGNTIYGCTNGMNLYGDSYDIHDNIIHDNTYGIRLSSSDGSEVYDNTVYNNGTVLGGGVIFDGGSTNCNGYRNLCYNNRYGLLANTSSTGIKFFENISILNQFNINYDNSATGDNYNNTCYGATTAELLLGAGYTGTSKNNLLCAVDGYCIKSSVTSGVTSDYNLLYVTGSGHYGKWGAASDDESLVSWQTTSSQDANSVSGDPLLANAGETTAEDYRVSSGSPANEAGADLSGLGLYSADYFGTAIPQGALADIGAIEGVFASGSPYYYYQQQAAAL
jgi:parallel beta-helix repeat protein